MAGSVAQNLGGQQGARGMLHFGSCGRCQCMNLKQTHECCLVGGKDRWDPEFVCKWLFYKGLRPVIRKP